MTPTSLKKQSMNLARIFIHIFILRGNKEITSATLFEVWSNGSSDVLWHGDPIQANPEKKPNE